MANPLDVIIDVSDAQGVIDFHAVASAGIKVAFVKAVEGRTFTAKTFDTNRKGFAAVGIQVIPYDFLRAGFADEQYQHFVTVAGLSKTNPLCMLDWEGRAADTCTPDLVERIAKSLRQITGRDPIGYWGRDGSTPYPPTPYMRAMPRFVPAYPKAGVQSWYDVPTSINQQKEWPNALFAQYTQWGRVPGIKGNVDRSVWFGTTAELINFLDTGKVPTTAISTVPSSLSVPLGMGSTGPLVRIAQDRLQELGFNVHGPDGIFGKWTRDAVTAFRKAHKLPIGTVIDNQTWTALFSK